MFRGSGDGLLGKVFAILGVLLAAYLYQKFFGFPDLGR